MENVKSPKENVFLAVLIFIDVKNDFEGFRRVKLVVISPVFRFYLSPHKTQKDKKKSKQNSDTETVLVIAQQTNNVNCQQGT